MKFSIFRELRRDTIFFEDVLKYLKVDLTNTLRDLATGLQRLSFSDNFISFTHEVVDLDSQKEIGIPNQMIENGIKIIPSAYVLLGARSGRDSAGALLVNNVPVSIVTGDTEWTTDTLFLKNVGSQRATFKVLFLK